MKTLSDLLTFIKLRKILLKIKEQDFEVKNKQIEKSNDQYVFERLQADIKYFELRNMQLNNSKDKLLVSRLVSVGRNLSGIIRRNFRI